MKKIALVLGVIAAALILTSCASKKAQPVANSEPPAQAAPAHHDLKGERL
jgi:PBP1b-binding outer membrane lipoprotein LpoB